jgi:hypothetical protein
LEKIPPEFLGETELLVSPDSLTFAELLLAESQVSLDHGLGRNLIHGILDHTQGPSAEQSSYLDNDPRRFLELTEQWWVLPIDQRHEASYPDGAGANSTNDLMNWDLWPT